MAEESPERPPAAKFAEALNVTRNATVGFAVGVALALLLIVAAVTGPGGQYPAAAYVALGFVLAVGVGLLLTVVFTLGSAYRLAKRQ